MSYTLLSIDPGISALGYAFSTVDITYTVHEANTVHPNKFPNDSVYKREKRLFPQRVLNGKRVSEIFEDLVLTYRPDYITSEDAFFNPLRPNAFIALIIALFAMETSLHKLYRQKAIPDRIGFYKTPPTVVKKILNEDVGGKALKQDMLTALIAKINSGDIQFDIDQLDGLSEHAVDAIGVGYAFTKLWMPMLEANLLDNTMTSVSRSLTKHLIAKKYMTPYLKLK